MSGNWRPFRLGLNVSNLNDILRLLWILRFQKEGIPVNYGEEFIKMLVPFLGLINANDTLIAF